MRGPIVLAMPLFAVLAVVVACSPSYPLCHRGEYQGCSCLGGATGYQACDVTESGYLACTCDGTTPGVDGGRVVADASGEADAPADAASGGAYMTPCGANDACAGAGSICSSFVGRGKICTKPCTQATDCPAPSPGCNMQGICRAP
jgi:hypothetical protein